MALPLRTSGSGLELIKSFEGFRARAAQLPNGQWIIGFGHTDSARAGLRVTRSDAELILRHHDLAPIEKLIAERVFAPLSQHEFDALVSFVFNIGTKAFLESDVLSHLNRGDRLQAAEGMTAWRKGRVDGELKVLDALIRRRAAEKALFLEHPAGRAALPSALVRAELDTSLTPISPRERAVIVETRIDDDRASASPRSRPTSSTTQSAARAVAERQTRILQETAPRSETSAPVYEESDGPSIDEITRAVSALADPDGPADSPILPREILRPGPPEGVERRRKPRPEDGAKENILDLNSPILRPLDAGFVDDLEQVEIDPDEVERVVAENDNLPVRPPAKGMFDDFGFTLLYGLLGGLGAIGLVVGGQRILAGSPGTADASFLGGPLLALGGAMLLLMASYYLYRSLTRGD